MVSTPRVSESFPLNVVDLLVQVDSELNLEIVWESIPFPLVSMAVNVVAEVPPVASAVVSLDIHLRLEVDLQAAAWCRWRT